MTAITAKTAGVKTVWVANPKPDKFALAAAHVAGDPCLLRVACCRLPIAYGLVCGCDGWAGVSGCRTLAVYVNNVLVGVCGCKAGRLLLPASLLVLSVPAPLRRFVAAIAGADGFLKCGGAHAIGALAQGVGIVPECNIIVGPGNQWVTAAKSIVQGKCAIDMLAGCALPLPCLRVSPSHHHSP